MLQRAIQTAHQRKLPPFPPPPPSTGAEQGKQRGQEQLQLTQISQLRQAHTRRIREASARQEGLSFQNRPIKGLKLPGDPAPRPGPEASPPLPHPRATGLCAGEAPATAEVCVWGHFSGPLPRQHVLPPARARSGGRGLSPPPAAPSRPRRRRCPPPFALAGGGGGGKAARAAPPPPQDGCEEEAAEAPGPSRRPAPLTIAAPAPQHGGGGGEEARDDRPQPPAPAGNAALTADHRAWRRQSAAPRTRGRRPAPGTPPLAGR